MLSTIETWQFSGISKAGQGLGPEREYTSTATPASLYQPVLRIVAVGDGSVGDLYGYIVKSYTSITTLGFTSCILARTSLLMIFLQKATLRGSTLPSYVYKYHREPSLPILVTFAIDL